MSGLTLHHVCLLGIRPVTSLPARTVEATRYGYPETGRHHRPECDLDRGFHHLFQRPGSDTPVFCPNHLYHNRDRIQTSRTTQYSPSCGVSPYVSVSLAEVADHPAPPVSWRIQKKSGVVRTKTRSVSGAEWWRAAHAWLSERWSVGLEEATHDRCGNGIESVVRRTRRMCFSWNSFPAQYHVLVLVLSGSGPASQVVVLGRDWQQAPANMRCHPHERSGLFRGIPTAFEH